MANALVSLNGIAECHLSLISFPDPDEMVGIAEVKLGEDMVPLKKLNSR